jgi:hypothetical protein
MLGFFVPWIIKALCEPEPEPYKPLSAKARMDRDLPDLSGIDFSGGKK